MANISNTNSNTLLSGLIDVDTISNGDGYWSGDNVSLNGSAKGDFMVNERDRDAIDSGAGNDTIINRGDHVTLSGGKDNDQIILAYDSSKTLIKYATGDGNDTITGFNSTSTLRVSGSYSTQVSGNDVLVKVGSGKITLKNVYATANRIHINGNTTSLARKTITLSGYDNVVSRDSISVVGSAQEDWINVYGDRVTINSGKGDDHIYNDGDHVSINAGAGNDLIYLDYDAEDNVIVYNSGDGNDSVSGFDSNDTLKIAASSYSTKKSGSNVIVTVGTGKITLAGAATLSSVHINKISSSGGSTSSTTKTVTNSTSSPVTVGSAMKTVNASSRTKAVKITGNSLANTITGGSGKDTIYGGAGNDSIVGNAGADKLYGQKGNDTLWGGAGNDSLWGGDGNNTFIFRAGEGTDRIFDFDDDDDMLRILKSDGSAGGKFTGSKFSGETLSLTISGGGQVILNDVDRDDTFNINGTTYRISGSKLTKK